MLQSKLSQILLGIFTLLPLIYMGYFFSIMFQQINVSPSALNEENFNFLFKLHLSTMGLIFILLAIYIAHLFRSGAVPEDKKALWAVVPNHGVRSSNVANPLTNAILLVLTTITLAIQR